MSIGNLKDTGNQGNNFPWQYKMLLGLDSINSNIISGNITNADSMAIDAFGGTLGAYVSVDWEEISR